MLGFTASAVAFYRFAPALPTTAAPAPAPTSAQSEPVELAHPDRSPLTVDFPHPVRRTQPPVKPRTPVEPRSADKLPSGPGTTRPGILLIATPASDGTFDVSRSRAVRGPGLRDDGAATGYRRPGWTFPQVERRREAGPDQCRRPARRGARRPSPPRDEARIRGGNQTGASCATG